LFLPLSINDPIFGLVAEVKGMMYNAFFEGRCSMITTFYLPTKIIFGAGSFNQLEDKNTNAGEEYEQFTTWR
jgi:hypothetical protein